MANETNRNSPRTPVQWLAFAIQLVTGPWTRENGLSWAKLIAFILVFSWLVIQLYRIPSGSMEPTLHGDPAFFSGDRVAVNKLAFGTRVPFTTKRIFRTGAPKRWDIVVFHAVDPDADKTVLIKRVVALPGERVNIRDGKIWIDGKVAEPPAELADILDYTRSVGDPEYEHRAIFLNMALTGEDRLGIDINDPRFPLVIAELRRVGQSFVRNGKTEFTREEVMEATGDVNPQVLALVEETLAMRFMGPEFRYGILEDDEFSVVPDDHYFMLGDNSRNSSDGRYFGWVPHDNLYGRAFAIVLPPWRMRDLTGFTGTWWGLALLIGIPAGLLGTDLYRRRKSARAPGPATKP